MIDEFEGKYAFLSNFYDSPIVDRLNGVVYPSVEHYFQAKKTVDMNEYIQIVHANTPGKAKRLGRECHLREDWEDVKEAVMEEGLRLKFADPELRRKLIDTYPNELVEGNHWHDNTWGDCRCAKCRNRIGQNKLGKLLMKLRSEYMS